VYDHKTITNIKNNMAKSNSYYAKYNHDTNNSQD
jgi:hypothetical protein